MAADNTTPATKKPSKRLVVWLSIIGAGFLTAVGTGVYQWVSSAIPDGPPFAAKLEVVHPECEAGVLDSSLPLPDRDEFTPTWIYENGGATSADQDLVLTIQGTSDQAVVLHGLEVMELDREKLPPDWRNVSPCKPFGGPLDVRYFAIDFADTTPRFEARPGGGEEAIDFPYTVSKTEPEYFVILFDDTKRECVCTWQLGIRWTSGNESGTLVADRGFGKIRTVFAKDLPFFYWDESGELIPF